MEIGFFWLLLSAMVAGAANSRGRSGFGWLLASIVVSPLLAWPLVCALPRKRNDPPVNDRPEATPQRSPPERPAFSPDGVYAGFPYKVSEAGAVEVMMSGGRVRFRSMEQFLALAIKPPDLGELHG